MGNKLHIRKEGLSRFVSDGFEMTRQGAEIKYTNYMKSLLWQQTEIQSV